MTLVFRAGQKNIQELIIRHAIKSLALLAVIVVAPVFAQDTGNSAAKTEGKPRFEFGLASAALQVPAYPSSSVDTERLFVLPWFIYRSDKLQVKDGGVQLIAYQSDRLIMIWASPVL